MKYLVGLLLCFAAAAYAQEFAGPGPCASTGELSLTQPSAVVDDLVKRTTCLVLLRSQNMQGQCSNLSVSAAAGVVDWCQQLLLPMQFL